MGFWRYFAEITLGNEALRAAYMTGGGIGFFSFLLFDPISYILQFHQLWVDQTSTLQVVEISWSTMGF